jgi:5-methylcytosine-specific restriction endonuclease McrA
MERKSKRPVIEDVSPQLLIQWTRVIDPYRKFFLENILTGSVINLDSTDFALIRSLENFKDKKKTLRLAEETGIYSHDINNIYAVSKIMETNLGVYGYEFRKRLNVIKDNWNNVGTHFNISTGKKNLSERLKKDLFRNDDYSLVSKDQDKLNYFVKCLQDYFPKRQKLYPALGTDKSSPDSTKPVEEKTKRKSGEKERKRHSRKKQKQKIPESTRSIVWRNHNGELMTGKCFCCVEKITYDKQGFHCGHIVPESKGGTIAPSNLRPVCASCNTAMQSRHMYEWMRSMHMPGVTNIPKNESETSGISGSFGIPISSKQESFGYSHIRTASDTLTDLLKNWKPFG